MGESRLIEGTREIAKELKAFFENDNARFSIFFNPIYGNNGCAFAECEAGWSTIDQHESDGILYCGDVYRAVTARDLTAMINEERRKARA